MSVTTKIDQNHQKESPFRWVNDLSGLFIVAVITHAFVLIFIFPGHYDPLLFSSSDFFLPISFKYTDWDIFYNPRPIGMGIMYIAGLAGIYFSVMFVLIVIFINVSIISYIIAKLLRNDINIYYYIIYIMFCFIVFSDPFFITMALHDSLAQISFLFLSCAFLLIINKSNIGFGNSVVVFFLILFGFMSKETYLLSMLGFLGVVAFMRRQQGVLAACRPFFLAVAALLVMGLYNIKIGSMYVLGGGDYAAAYQKTYNPIVILYGIGKYFRGEFQPGAALVFSAIILICFCVAQTHNRRFLIVALMIGAVAAIIPNSMLPFHFFEGYAWDMSYLLFAPILTLPAMMGGNRVIVASTGVVLTALLIALMPHFWRPIYALDAWELDQAQSMRNIINSLDLLTAEASFGQEPRRVLISGLISASSPFDNGPALQSWTGHKNVQFYDIIYAPRGSLAMHNGPVTYLTPSQVHLEDYTDVWTFSPKGIGKAISVSDQVSELDLFKEKDFILYPSLKEAFGRDRFKALSTEVTGSQYLQCGDHLMNYHAYSQALICLNRAEALLPNDPWVRYYKALCYQALGMNREALEAVEMAVKNDKSEPPIAFFAPLVRSLEGQLEIP